MTTALFDLFIMPGSTGLGYLMALSSPSPQNPDTVWEFHSLGEGLWLIHNLQNNHPQYWLELEKISGKILMSELPDECPRPHSHSNAAVLLDQFQQTTTWH